MEISNEANVIEKLFQIQTKEGLRVPYKLNPAQRFFDSIDDGFNRTRVLIAKARQKGFSSIILAKFGVRCLGKEGTHAVCMSHEAGATQRLLDKVDYYLKFMRGPKPVFGRHSRSEMYFDKMDSAYYIGTAGSKAFGRGDFVTDLHCSEYAFWDNPIKHFAGLFQAVPQSGRIYIESTGNGRNNDFFYLWENAEAMGYQRLFYPWFADTEYSLEIPFEKSTWKPDTPKFNEYLIELKHKHKLTDTQMYWYEMKLREMRESLPLMQQEYPSEPDECFQATGGSIFNIELATTPNWQASKFEGFYAYQHLGHPIANYHYVLGADPSGGTGHDDAAIIVFCAETYEQVFEFANNRVNPITFGEVVCKAATYFNNAFVICESNNHGAAVIPYLKDNYKRDKLYKRSYGTATTPPIYGWLNSRQSKHALIGTMQEMLPEIQVYGIQTIKEIKGFEETEEGKMSGTSDNLVIASGLGMIGLKKYESYRKEFVKPAVVVEKIIPNYLTYNLDDILQDLRKRKSSLRNQTGAGYPSLH